MQLVLSMAVAAPPTAVWQALVHPPARAAWWRDGIVLEPWPGGAFAEPWRDPDGKQQVTRGRVLIFLPPRLLELSWRDDDWPAATSVRISLSATADGCRLQLVHGGWADTAHELMAAHEAGWRSHLESLRAHVEQNQRHDGRV